MSSEAALTHVARSASESVAAVLETLVPGQVQAGDVALLEPGSDPLAGLPYPAVATSVAFGEGESGGAVFVMTLGGARRLAAAVAGDAEPAGAAGAELDELERSAVAGAMSQVTPAAVGALSALLGAGVETSASQLRTFGSEAEAAGAHPAAPHVVRAAFSVFGEPCRLALLIPDALAAGLAGGLDGPGAAAAAPGVPSLAGIPVRVWAELGRTSMASADVVGLPHGAVVELDRGPDEPIDLFVNGRHFATGRLVVVDSDWAVRIERVLDPSDAAERSVSS